MSVSGMRRLEILQHHDFTVGLSFWLVSEGLLRQSIRRRCRKVQPKSALSCALPCASWCFRGPALWRRGVQMAYCRCGRHAVVSITVSAAHCQTIERFFQLRPGRRRNVSTTILPFGPVNTQRSPRPGKQRRFRQRLRVDRLRCPSAPHGRQESVEGLRPAAGGQERRRSKDLPEKVAPATRFPQTRRNFATFRAAALLLKKISAHLFRLSNVNTS